MRPRDLTARFALLFVLALVWAMDSPPQVRAQTDAGDSTEGEPSSAQPEAFPDASDSAEDGSAEPRGEGLADVEGGLDAAEGGSEDAYQEGELDAGGLEEDLGDTDAFDDAVFDIEDIALEDLLTGPVAAATRTEQTGRRRSGGRDGDYP